MKLRKRIKAGRRVFDSYESEIVSMLGFHPLSEPYVYYAHPISSVTSDTLPILAADTLNKKGYIRRKSACHHLLQHFLPNELLGEKVRMLHPALHLNGEALIEEVGLSPDEVVALDMYLASRSVLVLMSAAVPSYGAFCEALAASKENVPVVAVAPHCHFSLFLPAMVNTVSLVTTREVFDNVEKYNNALFEEEAKAFKNRLSKLLDEADAEEHNCSCCQEAHPNVTVHETDKSTYQLRGVTIPITELAGHQQPAEPEQGE